jgi:2-dehydropantoate 2-reductase
VACPAPGLRPMSFKNVLIVGAGAIGGYIGAAIASGLALEAIALTVLVTERSGPRIRTEGLTVLTDQRMVKARPNVITELSPDDNFDLIVVSVKSHRAPEVLLRLSPLVNRGATLLTAMNGVPWWFASSSSKPITAIDPNGLILRSLPPQSIVAAVVDFACHRTREGIIHHSFGRSLTLGSVVPSSDGPRKVASLLSGSLLDCAIVADIRTAIWSKLINNASMNATSVLADATLADMCSFGAGRNLLKRAMIEVQRVGEGLGLGPFEDIDARIESRAAFGRVKTSMLQDWENNEDLELDAILTAVIELGEWVRIATPTLRTILELSVLKVEARKTRASDL